jgi:hypothetical protein
VAKPEIYGGGSYGACRRTIRPAVWWADDLSTGYAQSGTSKWLSHARSNCCSRDGRPVIDFVGRITWRGVLCKKCRRRLQNIVAGTTLYSMIRQSFGVCRPTVHSVLDFGRLQCLPSRAVVDAGSKVLTSTYWDLRARARFGSEHLCCGSVENMACYMQMRSTSRSVTGCIILTTLCCRQHARRGPTRSRLEGLRTIRGVGTGQVR